MCMIRHNTISDADLRQRIAQNKIRLGGNEKLKIYGSLHCKQGKRMKRENRVFFRSEEEALLLSYRPCGHCMKSKYQNWKNGFV